MAYSKEQKKEIQDKILDLIIEGGTVRDSIKKIGISTSTFFGWLETDDIFSKQYARAMDIGLENLADEILAIADDSTYDVYIKDGVEVVNKDVIARAKLKMEARQWLLTKRKPKKYGNQLDVSTNGETLNAPINIVLGVVDAKKKK